MKRLCQCESSRQAGERSDTICGLPDAVKGEFARPWLGGSGAISLAAGPIEIGPVFGFIPYSPARSRGTRCLFRCESLAVLFSPAYDSILT